MKHNTIQNKWINECIDTQVDTCKTFIYNISETHEYSVVMNLSNSFTQTFYSLCKIPQTAVEIECKIPT